MSDSHSAFLNVSGAFDYLHPIIGSNYFVDPSPFLLPDSPSDIT